MFRHFLLALFLLLIASAVTVLISHPEKTEGKPVLYWVTDNNPERKAQVAAFELWLKANNYPPMELRLDSANKEMTKRLIQGVSGIGGDIIDMGGVESLMYFVDMGLLADVGAPAAEMGFESSRTYPAERSDIAFGGKQYGFPCNISVGMLIANDEQFRQAGLALPPSTCTMDEFEKIGLQFVRRSKEIGGRQQKFFCNEIPHDVIRRSYGIDLYNETLTGPALERPGGEKALERLRHWLDWKLIPGMADLYSMSSEGGYGGQAIQQFQAGNYALVWSGRHAIIQLRRGGPMQLSVIEPPFASFRNTSMTSRIACIYRGGEHQELAARFLEFLATTAYGTMITEDGDSLPPLPESAATPEFSSPAQYPNEMQFHDAFARAAATIAVGATVSPFVNPLTVKRLDLEAMDAFKAGLRNPAETLRLEGDAIRKSIARSVQERQSLRATFEQQLKMQERIDECLREERKIPAAWISNPFYLRYYASRNLLEYGIAHE